MMKNNTARSAHYLDSMKISKIKRQIQKASNNLYLCTYFAFALATYVTVHKLISFIDF